MQKTNAEKFLAKRRAFLVRALASGLMASGGMLSLSRRAGAQLLGRVPGPLAQGQSIYDITGPTSTIGVRGTGLYVEAEPERTYVCTCYGDTDKAAIDDPAITERIVSFHHDAPRYVLARPD